MRGPIRPILLAACAAAGLACDSGTAPPGRTHALPDRIEIVSGDAQQGVVGQALTEPLIVRVVDASGRAVAGQTVNFAVVSGGGTVGSGTDVSDTAGLATQQWTLGTTAADSQVVEARLQVSGRTLAARFRADAMAAAVARLDRASADSQRATITRPVSVAPRVRLFDRFGNVVAGGAVSFVVTAGGGSVDLATVASNDSGYASPGAWRVGSSLDTNRLTARVAGIDSVTFVAIVQPPRIELTTRPPDTVQNRTVFAVAPVVALRDETGAPVSAGGIPVTVLSGRFDGQLFGTTTVLTDANGRATFSELVFAGRAGSLRLSFFAFGLRGDSAMVMITPGAPARLVSDGRTGDTAFTLVEANLRPSVALIDLDGNGVPAAAVTFTVTAGGGTISEPQVVTNARGVATAGRWTLGPTEGSNRLTATTTAVADSVVFTALAVGVLRAIRVSVGSQHVCALDAEGKAYCWGRNDWGQLGDGTSTLRSRAVAVATSLRFVSISAGTRHTCALTAAGQAYCWGEGTQGSLGDGSNTSSLTPVAVAGGHAFRAIAVDRSASAGMLPSEPNGATCAVTLSDVGYCWGGDRLLEGRLGVGTGGNRSVPTMVAGGIAFREIQLGRSHTCGVSTSGLAYCWGSKEHGGGGDFSTEAPHATSPRAVAGGRAYDAIAVGPAHTCATAAASLYCWGVNTDGQLAHDPQQVTSALQPLAVSGSPALAAVSANDQGTCALDASGNGYCWGAVGRHAYGGLIQMLTSVHGSAGYPPGMHALEAGRTSCFIAPTHIVYCRGSTLYGQTGAGRYFTEATGLDAVRLPQP